MAQPSEASNVEKIINRATVCDLTLPWSRTNENREPTLPRFAAAGFNFVSLTVGMDWNSPLETVQHIAAERNRFLNDKNFVLAESVSDIRRAKTESKLAVGFHFQGTNPFGGDVNMVEVFYRLGVRHALLAYNEKNAVGDGCHERTDAGLSRYGIRLIAEMNRVGMIVDCTHTGYRTAMEAMELSTSPVIFSHSNAHAIWPHDRNLRDDQIKACAAKGGVIGINGVGLFLGNNDASPANFIRHIDHIAGLVGPRHIALGLDLVYYMDSMLARWRANPGRYPEGYPEPPWYFFAPEDLPRLVDGLLQRGYADDDVVGILGENFLRVAETVWR